MNYSNNTLVKAVLSPFHLTEVLYGNPKTLPKNLQNNLLLHDTNRALKLPLLISRYLAIYGNPRFVYVATPEFISIWKRKGIQTVASIFHQDPTGLKLLENCRQNSNYQRTIYTDYNQLTTFIKSCYNLKKDPFLQSFINQAIIWWMF